MRETLTKLTRATSRNSFIMILLQVILGSIAVGYFTYHQQYYNIFYGIVTGFVMMHVLHNISLHRYFAHNSFKTSKFWHAVMAMTSPLACGGSPYGYAMAHRTHHIYSDTDRDPHYKGIGFFNISFFKWNLKKVPIRTMGSLNETWILRSHNYYVMIIVLFYAMLLAINPTWALIYNIAGLWLYLSYLTINIVDHRNIWFGYRNFDTDDKSMNDIVTGYIVGEWHNNHHKNPQQWNQRVRWWEFDLNAQLVKLIKK